MIYSLSEKVSRLVLEHERLSSITNALAIELSGQQPSQYNTLSEQLYVKTFGLLKQLIRINRRSETPKLWISNYTCIIFNTIDWLLHISG